MFICLQHSGLGDYGIPPLRDLLAPACLNSADWWPFSANEEVWRVRMNWGEGGRLPSREVNEALQQGAIFATLQRFGRAIQVIDFPNPDEQRRNCVPS